MQIERGKKQPEAHLDNNIAIVSNAGNVSNSDTDSCEVASLESASGVDSPQRAMGCTDNRVTLNIGGQYFTTYQSTIHSYPGTRLSSISRSDTAYDSASGEYFFDRNPRLFPYILDFYRSGELHFPHCTCGTVIQQELAFWGISDDKVATCCWRTYKEFEEEKRTLDELEEAFNGHKKMFRGKDNYRIRGSLTNGWTKWKMDVLKFLEDPSSSKPAKAWASLYICLLLISIGVVVAESDPLFRVPSEMDHKMNTVGNQTSNPKLKLYLTTDSHPVLSGLDYICTITFSLELLFKFLVWPNKLKFLCHVFNLIDILSIVPMFTMSVIRLWQPQFWVENDEVFFAYCILSFSSVFRSIRILKLVKHNRGLQIIYLAIRHSAKEIMLLLLLIFIGTLVFSTMIYFAEFQEEETFVTIPIGFWWSIVTMTTVGYGDKYPTSGMGYLVGSMCAITGMLATGLPIPVIANSFHLYYTYARVKSNIDEKRAAACDVAEDVTDTEQFHRKSRKPAFLSH